MRFFTGNGDLYIWMHIICSDIKQKRKTNNIDYLEKFNLQKKKPANLHQSSNNGNIPHLRMYIWYLKFILPFGFVI